MNENSRRSEPKSQLDKFKELAKSVETDDNEAAFDRALKKVAKAKQGQPIDSDKKSD